MSDYVHNRVIRYPLKDLIKKLEKERAWDLEDFLRDKLKDFWNINNIGFEIEGTTKEYYLDFVYYHNYGDESSDFGFVREITDEEYILVQGLFERVFEDFDRNKLRVVDYCYYNCSECQDYYDLPGDDDFEEIKEAICRMEEEKTC